MNALQHTSTGAFRLPSSPILPSRSAATTTVKAFPSQFAGPQFLAAVKKREINPRRGGVAMMGPAAGSYATALIDIALSNSTLEQTSADVDKIEKVFCEDGVMDFFLNPIIEIQKKREIVSEIAQSAKLQPHSANFINILIDMNRIALMKEIVKEFDKLYNKSTGTEMAIVSSVVKLESKQLAQIAQTVQRLTGSKNVRIKTVLDPTLIAGFTIRYGTEESKLIDMSVKKQLKEIADQLDVSKVVTELVKV